MRTDRKASGSGSPNAFVGYIRKNKQLLIPLSFLTILLLINVIMSAIAGMNFFNIWLEENGTLHGYPISILNRATPLLVITLGMTLVTAACGGQDISVGALTTIAGATFYRVISIGGYTNPWAILLGFVLCCIVTMLFGAFNGTLVSVFRIQPMIATLILFSCGRKIANWIANVDEAVIDSAPVKELGSYLPGVAVPTPLLIGLVVGVIFFLMMKLTNIGMYAQSVGINQSAARLNGINPTMVKLLTFIILGACCAVAGFIRTCDIQKVSYETHLQDIEMDAILAVAIGGNSLGGGKFSLVGSVLGAYTLQTLSTTLDRFNIKSTDIKAYKAIVIILLVVIGSDTVKKMISRLISKSKIKKAGINGEHDQTNKLTEEGA
ncbi:MAG: ABC transporter permease [Clostridia bacterium]|nr:ABC transporter permease [Clostridia bacterium]